MLSTIRQDLTFALRQLRRSPGFALASVLTLALGIGATTSIFSLVDGILLRPLPFRQPDRLVAINTLEFPPGVAASNVAAADSNQSSYPDFFDWQRQNHTFESLASCDPSERLFSKPNGEGARVLSASRISANLFPVLGVAPELGRGFTAEEEQPGHRVVILSHRLWVSDFASSPAALGQIVKISDVPYTIVGVMPPGFNYPVEAPAYLWATYSIDSEGAAPATAERDRGHLSVVGRLKPGVEAKQALADLNAIQSRLAQQYDEDHYRLAVAVTPLLEATTGDARSVLSVLFIAVAMVLIIGCANVAGLLLARANGRRAEVAVRTALGASRIRIVRQLLIESLLLALAGGATGILISYALLHAVLQSIPRDVPRLYNVALDGRVLAFAILLSAATAIIFGLIPAWKASQADPATDLRDTGPAATAGRRQHRSHHVLVVAETALGFTLLIGSGLLIRSLVNELAIDPGFDTAHTLSFDTALTLARYPNPTRLAFFDKLLPQLAALPGVERVSSGHPLPDFWANSNSEKFHVVGHTETPETLPEAIDAVVEPGYFETLSIPLLRGRTFTGHDNLPNSPPVAIISQSLARKFFPNEDPIGRFIVPGFQLGAKSPVGHQIVGIVGNTRTAEDWDPYQPEYYVPYAQNVEHQRPLVVMKVAGDPLGYEHAIRQVVAGIDKDVPVFRFRSSVEDVGRLSEQPRFEAALISGFAAVALLLSAVGLYAVLSYMVAVRSRELGLRMALGATPLDILRLVLQRGAILAMVGIAVGAFVSFCGSAWIADVLFNVSPLDRSVFLIVTLVLLVVSLLASLIPALRAARVDPMRTLREQ